MCFLLAVMENTEKVYCYFIIIFIILTVPSPSHGKNQPDFFPLKGASSLHCILALRAIFKGGHHLVKWTHLHMISGFRILMQGKVFLRDEELL